MLTPLAVVATVCIRYQLACIIIDKTALSIYFKPEQLALGILFVLRFIADEVSGLWCVAFWVFGVWALYINRRLTLGQQSCGTNNTRYCMEITTDFSYKRYFDGI